MKENVPVSNSEPPIAGLRAATAVCRDRGFSNVTLWRWARRGWIKTTNVAGRVYVDLGSLADFDRRASAGEFAKAPRGAAKTSAEKARTALEERREADTAA